MLMASLRLSNLCLSALAHDDDVSIDRDRDGTNRGHGEDALKSAEYNYADAGQADDEWLNPFVNKDGQPDPDNQEADVQHDLDHVFEQFDESIKDLAHPRPFAVRQRSASGAAGARPSRPLLPANLPTVACNDGMDSSATSPASLCQSCQGPEASIKEESTCSLPPSRSMWHSRCSRWRSRKDPVRSPSATV